MARINKDQLDTTLLNSTNIGVTVQGYDVNTTKLGNTTTGTGSIVRGTSPAITTPTGIVKGDVGLGSVDNTSDANKPVSTATQTALNLKQNTVALTTTGTSGASTFNPTTGALNIPNYATGGGSSTKDLFYYQNIGTTSYERWYQAGRVSGVASTTASYSISFLRAIPQVITRGGTLDRLGISVTAAAASGQARIGVYSNTSDTNLYPSTLIVDSGVISTAAIANVSATISQALTANTLVWFVVSLGTAAPTLAALTVGSMSSILGTDNTISGTMGTFIQVSTTFGALPTTFPAGATMAAGGAPIIGYRFSA